MNLDLKDIHMPDQEYAIPPFRDALMSPVMPLHTVFAAVHEIFPKLDIVSAQEYLQQTPQIFGVANLLDSPNASLKLTDKGWNLINPVFDLLYDERNHLRFTGQCHQIEPAMLVVLQSLNTDTDLVPINVQMGFSGKTLEYSHHFVGRMQYSDQGFRPAAKHILDPSKYYRQLMQPPLTGASYYSAKEYLASSERRGVYTIDAQNPLSGIRIPYLEVADTDRTSLVSIGFEDTERATEISVSVNVIDHANRIAPSTVYEVVFDFNQPEKVLDSLVDEFDTYLNWKDGCTYKQTQDMPLEYIPEKDRQIILDARDRFGEQLNRLLKKLSR